MFALHHWSAFWTNNGQLNICLDADFIANCLKVAHLMKMALSSHHLKFLLFVHVLFTILPLKILNSLFQILSLLLETYCWIMLVIWGPGTCLNVGYWRRIHWWTHMRSEARGTFEENSIIETWTCVQCQIWGLI